jgi:hypothetical protein
MIAAMLAGCTFPSHRGIDSPSSSTSDGCPVSVTGEPAINGGAGLLLAPTTKRLAASAGSLRPTPNPVERITP